MLDDSRRSDFKFRAVTLWSAVAKAELPVPHRRGLPPYSPAPRQLADPTTFASLAREELSRLVTRINAYRAGLIDALGAALRVTSNAGASASASAASGSALGDVRVLMSLIAGYTLFATGPFEVPDLPL